MIVGYRESSECLSFNNDSGEANLIISILTHAADVLVHPDAFTSESFATDCNGNDVPVTSPKVARFGIFGALAKAELDILGALPTTGKTAADLVIDVACRMGLQPDSLTFTDARRILDAAIERAWQESGPRKVVAS